MASVVRCTHEEREDLLPWPIRTRKRGSNSRAMVSVDNVELPVREVGPALPLEVVNLPLKKRVLPAAAAPAPAPAPAENENENQFACILCGRAFKSYWAMCGHKAHHTLTEKRKKKRLRLEEEAAAALVVYEPPPPPPPQQRRIDWGPRRLCDRCGRTFVNGQGLGGHKRYCALRPQPAPVDIHGGGGGGKVIHQFDLNELPPPEPVEERLSLPWHGD